MALTSRTAEPTAQDIGFPPKVLKKLAALRACAISGVVTTAASGNPLPMPLAIVTVGRDGSGQRWVFRVDPLRPRF